VAGTGWDRRDDEMKKLGMFIIACAVMNVAAWGRPLTGPMEFSSLAAKADTIVIAQAETTTATNLVSTNGFGIFLEVDTVFTVRATLKGNDTGQRLILRHMSCKEKTGPLNGPMLVSFQTCDTTKPELTVGPTYLLFLNKVGEHYEPASGQFDAVFSVRTVNSDFLGLMKAGVEK
jgi:hypothetical protein